AFILLGAHPGIADETERAARTADDRARASMIRKLGLEAFVDRWEREPIFDTQRNLGEAARSALRTRRLSHTAEGAAWSLERLSTGAMAPVAVEDIRAHAVLAAGELDEKYVALARAV